MLLGLLRISIVEIFGGVRSQTLRKIMKGYRKRKTGEFKRGHIPHNKGIKCEKPKFHKNKGNKATIYIRPTHTDIGLVQKNPIVGAEMPSEKGAAAVGET